MGVVQNVDYEKFPKQGEKLGKKVKVAFNYVLSKALNGIVVRDDREEPGLTIIKLEDDRYVLSTECQFSIN